MRTHLLVSFAAVLAAAPAFSQDQATPAPAAQDQSVQVPAAQLNTKLQPQQLNELTGVYRLDNGGVFRMTRVGNRLMGQLGERPVTELVIQADNRFISRDQKMTIDYQAEAFGGQITLRYPSDLARLDGPMVTVRLAAN